MAVLAGNDNTIKEVRRERNNRRAFWQGAGAALAYFATLAVVFATLWLFF